ncbi:hypothetical protein KM176_24635 [Pseudooceanicola sp. CBS1P-1]|uniref:RiboL-PSP-HEPN domain-containing protein n=1 Tax=Pseudooceanicola albus TaxID=2692189 RepID=A0A6L7GDB0_9RHOB|nr:MULTISPECIES: hypothetical protein [Pseudooceanicola]MBT9387050.1 hypothetical protein [Pseudooceanicola endophyticus]MXN21220.1 hypothetical protein [Pseudooceanicola albus]
MVVDTITGIENWFKEPTSDNERPMLLSKLALIEFCGWLEEWMDESVRQVNQSTLNDADWVEENIIKQTHGFHYNKHFRPMLCSVLGEHSIREIEGSFEQNHQGDLELIRSTLGTLWRLRCNLAHADLAAHQRAQINIYAPSWTKNQYRLLSGRLDNFRNCILNSI